MSAFVKQMSSHGDKRILLTYVAFLIETENHSEKIEHAVQIDLFTHLELILRPCHIVE